MERPSEYVLVTGGKEVPSQLERALATELELRRCPGPQDVDCPAVRGERCPLREGAKFAVTFLAGEHEFHSAGRWDCVVGARSPAIAVVEGNRNAPRGTDDFVVVGSERGPVGVFEALALLSFDDE